MATIVNTRDVLLQATTPRIVAVSLPTNVQVPTAQVPGLDTALLNAKMVTLKASSLVYQVAKSGAISPNSAITLLAVLNNLAVTPSFSIVAGTVTGGAAALSASGNSASIPYGVMASDAVTIRATATDATGTYTSDVTIAKVREGLDGINGTDAYYATLTRDSAALQATSSGVTSGSVSTQFKVMKGSTDDTANWTLASTNSTGITAAAISGGIVTVTALNSANDTGDVTITATRASFPTLTRVFSISKSKTGVLGARGSMQFYVGVGISSWSDTTANSVSNVNGGTSLNDTVTQSNAGTGYSETRFWNGSAWVVVTQVIDGNLLVNGTVGAAKVSVSSLSAINANLGTCTAGQFMGGAYTGYAWPATGAGGGFYLGPSGLLLGSANDGKYVQITAGGDFYSPGMTIVGGSASFSGTLTAAAVNAVNTINIAGNAVTIPVSAYTAAAASQQYGSSATVTLTYDIQTATISSSGAPIVVSVGALLSTSAISTGSATAKILRDGTEIHSSALPINTSVPYSFTMSDTPGAGSHTYTLRFVVVQASVSNVNTYSSRSIVLMETKR